MPHLLGNDVGRAEFAGNVCVTARACVQSACLWGTERERSMAGGSRDSVHTAGTEDNLLFMQIDWQSEQAGGKRIDQHNTL